MKVPFKSLYSKVSYLSGCMEDIIEAHASPRILYRMIASNETEFNKPDDEDDVFALAVRALYGAMAKESQDLIHDILAAKPDGTRSTLSSVLCDEDEMDRYLNLLIIQMFKANRFISFWKLNNQKNVAQSVSFYDSSHTYALISSFLRLSTG